MFLPHTHHILFLQDFELWDDVGLNIPKPPDLLQLYRNCGNSLPLHRDTVDVAVNVDPKDLPGDYFTQEPVQQTEAIQVLFTCLHEHCFPIKVHILLKPLFWVMVYDKYFSHFPWNWNIDLVCNTDLVYLHDSYIIRIWPNPSNPMSNIYSKGIFELWGLKCDLEWSWVSLVKKMPTFKSFQCYPQ